MLEKSFDLSNSVILGQGEKDTATPVHCFIYFLYSREREST